MTAYVRHVVRFERNPATGEFRGQCSCGWQQTGAEQDVRLSAGTHDLDWIPEFLGEAKS